MPVWAQVDVGRAQVTHYLNLEQDEEGWDYASCACGWVGPPCPDSETASEFYAEHRLELQSQLDGQNP